MPKPTKQSGYLVKIEQFIAADMKDIEALAIIQRMLSKALSELGAGPADTESSITPTRR